VLGWFKKSKAPAEVHQQEPALSDEEQRAYDLTIAGEVEAYASGRQKEVGGNFLDVLQQQIDSACQQADHAPTTVAHVKYQIFRKETEKAQEKLIEETVSITRLYWGEKLLDDLGIDGERLTKLAKKFIGDWALTLTLDGLKIIQDNMDILKRADDRWRAKSPEMSALDPPVNA
jgi:hypothetical protein